MEKFGSSPDLPIDESFLLALGAGKRFGSEYKLILVLIIENLENHQWPYETQGQLVWMVFIL
jgi:hypothetical protein